MASSVAMLSSLLLSIQLVQFFPTIIFLFDGGGQSVEFDELGYNGTVAINGNFEVRNPETYEEVFSVNANEEGIKFDSNSTGIKSIKMYTGILPSNTYSLTLGLPNGWSHTDNIAFLSFGFGDTSDDFFYFTDQNGGAEVGIYARVHSDGVVVGFPGSQWGKKYRIVVALFE